MFQYWHPTKLERATMSDKSCPVCGGKGPLYPLCCEMNPNAGSDSQAKFAAGACEQCIQQGKFPLSDVEKQQEAKQLKRCGISEDDLCRCLDTIERHPRPYWVKYEWPAHCGDLANYLGEWEPRDFLKQKSSPLSDNEWFQSLWKVSQPTVAALYDVTVPKRPWIFWQRQRVLQQEEWTLSGDAYLHCFQCRSCSQFMPIFSVCG